MPSNAPNRLRGFRPNSRLGLWVVAVLFLVGFVAAALGSNASRPEISWDERAAAGQEALSQRFFSPERGLFSPEYPRGSSSPQLQYWWQAHAIDALVDAYERTGQESYLTRAAGVWEAVKHENQGVTNDYFDDMEWMALALLRLERHVESPALLRDVHSLWGDIKSGWNVQQGGGIAWRKSQRDYKNTPANAPAVILGCRMYALTGDEADLAWARKIYTWLNVTLVDADTGLVWDGINRRGDGAIDKSWMFTYNQGLRIGAALELHKATSEARFLNDANQTFVAASEHFTNEQGVLHERGRGDGGLFKGVLVRYVGDLACASSEQSIAARMFLATQAEAAWAHIADPALPTFGPDWSAAAREPVPLSAQLSGVMLMEQMARIERTTESTQMPAEPAGD